MSLAQLAGYVNFFSLHEVYHTLLKVVLNSPHAMWSNELRLKDQSLNRGQPLVWPAPQTAGHVSSEGGAVLFPKARPRGDSLNAATAESGPLTWSVSHD